MNLELPGAGRFDNYAQVHCLSFPVNEMVAFTALAMGGVLGHVRHASPKALPEPFYVLRSVVVPMQARSTVRAAMPADG